MELIVCQMLFILFFFFLHNYPRKQVSSRVMCYYLVIFHRPFKIAQLCSIRARPTLSITQQRSPPPSKTLHLGFNSSQKFSAQPSDNVQANKVCFSLRSSASVLNMSTCVFKKCPIMMPGKSDFIRVTVHNQ